MNGSCGSITTAKSIISVKEVSFFSCSLLKKGSPVEVLKTEGDESFWIAGTLCKRNGSNALVTLPGPDGNGNLNEWVEMKSGLDITNDPQAIQKISPKIRPSMKMGYFPQQVLNNCQGLEEILKIGDPMETWIKNKWIEGVYTGVNESGLLVKLPGNSESVMVHPSSVRLLPLWNDEQSSWEVTSLEVKTKDSNIVKAVDVEAGSSSGSDYLDQIPRSKRKKLKNPLKISTHPLINVETDNSSGSDYLNEIRKSKRKKLKNPSKISSHALINVDADNSSGSDYLNQIPKSKRKKLKNPLKISSHPLITALQYASRSEMLSSLVVSWSPLISLTSGIQSVSDPNTRKSCSILAIGGKSGALWFWKFIEPRSFSVMPTKDLADVSLVGFLHAHSGWITAISLILLPSDVLKPQLLLVTGSSDGSVKLWRGCSKKLLESNDVNDASFSLLKEIIAPDSVPVSVITLTGCGSSSHRNHLAVGKGSGYIEVWIFDACNATSKFLKVGSNNAHNHIITGLAWTFDGRCLYSCSQDNVLRCWIVTKNNSLKEVPIPSHTPELKSSIDVPNVVDSCLGLAVSPGNLVLAVARSFDVETLNPMYELRTQKAIVEFFWIGGQEQGEPFADLTGRENWERNILWSLNQFESSDNIKPVVIWDIVASLLAFKQSAKEFVQTTITKWLASLAKTKHDLAISKIFLKITAKVSKLGFRQLQLINVIGRRVAGIKSDCEDANALLSFEEEEENGDDEYQSLWMKLLWRSEEEVRARLVTDSFSCFLKDEGYVPAGLAQMKKWAVLNRSSLQDNVKKLEVEVGKSLKRLGSGLKYTEDEKCSYCSASVPFESAEEAFCRGEGGGSCNGNKKNNNKMREKRHKMERCCVTMQVSCTMKMWYCICCTRRASGDFLMLPSRKPICPFCGILMQKKQPGFLLSASPV
ncbi:uncharacterized protein LOC124931249 isoform X2 [Impatiens glandulifera]|nr:uncharacterized protein LOC124931249 isoform X2 [Impatiens glandulifera]